MPTTIPELPAWLVEIFKAAAVAVIGWMVGRRGSNAKASKTEAEASQIIAKTATDFAEEARKMAAAANARSEQIALENQILHAKVDRLLSPLVDFVVEWDRDCARCETRPVIPPVLAERIRKMTDGETH